MPGLVLNELKAPLELSDYDLGELKPGYAKVTLKAAALNHRDYWIIQGQYPGIELPKVLGSDGAGVVTQVGANDDQKWLDQEVIINPGWDWGTNEAAQSAEFNILGMPHNGTFSTHIHVPIETLRAKPKHLSWEEAAALPLAGVTAFRATMSQGQLRPGEKVLVSGIGGGVATFALQFAVAVGAEVAVTSSSAEKLAKAKEMGAVAGFNYREEGWHKEAAKTFGSPNLIIDSAAGKGYANLVDLAAPGGRIVNYGATTGPPEKLNLFKVFWNQLKLIGTTMGSPADFRGMLELVDKHEIHPMIDQVFSLAQGNEAIARMEQGQQFGKIVLKI
ncbi:zinc-binding dehydrogenase [Blastopirellula marina]|uniref:Alcohol dehydrogenase n=1 Tax=Blastopirellula marina TaxID=124 RepID=A0A2S8GP53_9BACT|nr:zinc-binding dehydrogenase [Blastopirellula marina]PQO46208.1 alcohol dehydrogenase [Blastopirellula marina]